MARARTDGPSPHRPIGLARQSGVKYKPEIPPSTRKVVAVINDESSLAKNAAAAAISPASPKRPMGMCTRRRAARSGSLAKSSCNKGVFTGPGQSAAHAGDNPPGEFRRRARGARASTPPFDAV